MKTFIFPGQGSQYRGMGEALFDEFSDMADKASNILGYSVKELCVNDTNRELNKTQFTQPAIYLVNAMSYMKAIQASSQKPDFVAGHSLGEFNALLVAECFSFESGLKLVKKRGELMGQASGGAMAAILNARKEEIEEILQKNQLSNIHIANYNTPSQLVVSGDAKEISQAEQYFKEGAVRYYPLNTSGAFHSVHMQSAKDKFATYLKKFKFSDPSIPVIANISARPYQSNKVVENLSGQITGAVKWCDSIQFLLAQGEMEFQEIGDSDVLTKMIARIVSETPVSLLDTIDKISTASKATTTIPDEKKSTAIDIKLSGEHYTFVEEQVSAWNLHCPIGTKVRLKSAVNEILETKTEAIALFGKKAVVYLENFNGYFELDDLEMLNDVELQTA